MRAWATAVTSTMRRVTEPGRKPHATGVLSELVRCKALNPDGQKYCGECGAALSTERAAGVSDLQPLIEEALERRLKEQKVVEIEVSQAIAARLVEWAKLLGFFVAIPLALLAVILGIMGFSDYKNFNDHINKSINTFDNKVSDIQKSLDSKVLVAAQSTTASMEQARQLSNLAKEESVRLTSELQRLRDLVDANSQKVASLATKVERIEQFGFEGFSASTEELRRKLESTLSSFQGHLQGLGYNPKAGKITVTITNEVESNAFFDKADNRIVLARNVADDISVAIQTYSIYVLTSTDVNKSGDSGGLIFGVADYLTCSFLGDSRLGRHFFKSSKVSQPGKDYLRELDNDLKFKDLANHSVQEVGEIWGGAFWEMRRRFGQVVADRLIFSAWIIGQGTSDVRGSTDVQFVSRLLESDKKLEGGKHVEQIRTIFEGRGLKLNP